MIKAYSRFVSTFITRYGFAIALALAILGAMGAFDALLMPMERRAHAEGRETPNTAIADPLDDTDTQSRILIFRGQAVFASLGMRAGLRQPTSLVITEGLGCTDWNGLLASDGQPDTWTQAGPIQHITVHSSGTPGDTTPQAVANWHVVGQKWEHVGYNYMITQDGHCHKTLPDGVMPYAQFRWNKNDIAIMLAGLDNFNATQVDTLNKLVVYLAKQYKVVPDMIKGHRDWSQIDQDAAKRGERVANVNDHVDPCNVGLHQTPCRWDQDTFGLRAAVARITAPPAQTYGPAPADHVEKAVATWYGEGKNSLGVPLQGNVMRCGGLFDKANTTTTSVYLSAARTPAYPCGMWLRVTNEATGQHHDVQVRDTGSFPFVVPSGPLVGQHHYLDLSEAAFSLLSGTPVETLQKTLGGNLHITIDTLMQDDSNCRYVPESGQNVCFAFREEYFRNVAFSQRYYGVPITGQYTDEAGRIVQDFSLGKRFIYIPDKLPLPVAVEVRL